VATLLSNIPYRTPIADQSGLVSYEWANWFRDLFKRTGAGSALSNTELESQIGVTTLQTQIDTLSATLTGLSSTVSTGLQGLGQGPQL
jgi:hypothetical protein